jgi:hypothetical protein
VKSTGLNNNPFLIGKKTFAAAVGPRDAFLYLRGTRGEGLASLLEGSYESEGRNVIYFKGECSCPDFTCVLAPALREGPPGRIDTRCKHIRAARAEFFKCISGNRWG